MLQRFLSASLLGIALLLLTFTLPGACLAEDEGPGEDSPPADSPPADSPPADSPPADGDGEPTPAPEPPPSPEEPAPKDDEPTEGEEPKDPSTTGGATQSESPAPVPAGMTYIEGGRVPIGSEFEHLDSILAGRPELVRKLFLYETPPHHVFLRPYFMGIHEVSNAQYHRHLQDYITEYDTASGSLANLDEIAAHMVGLSKEERASKHQVVWKQLYFANKDQIWKSLGKGLAALQMKRADETMDEEATARKIRFHPLPRTLKLTFYSIRLPHNWPSMHALKNEWDHPVRFVSYNDAERFAEWAGMHVPSEQEWEYAARGPERRLFPWGNDWERTEKYANWGGNIQSSTYETQTVPVSARCGSNPDGKKKNAKGAPLPIDGDGRSWCGCSNLVGNVAEWTSSWFEPYPGNTKTNTFMGRWVKILRGGSAADMEMLALRPACRNWIGGGPDAPPYPEATFKWSGFRLAAYMKSGRDQLSPIVRRAVRSKHVPEGALDVDNFVGSVTRNWIESGAEPTNHVYILGRSRAIVILPLRNFMREAGGAQMVNAWKRPNALKKVSGIAKKAAEDHPFWITGVLHSDVRIEPVQVRKAEDPKKNKKKGRRRGRAKAPLTEKGSCPPGTYLIGNWFGRLALLTPGKEFVCFLPPAGKKQKPFEVAKLAPGERGVPVLKVDPELDWADFEFQIPLGGKGVGEETRLITRGRLQFEVGSLETAGTWLQEDPAAVLTKILRDQFDAAAAAEAMKKPTMQEKRDAKKKKADEKKKAAKEK